MTITHEKILKHVLNTPEIASSFSWMNACSPFYEKETALYKEHPETMYMAFFADPFLKEALKPVIDNPFPNYKEETKKVYVLLSTRDDINNIDFYGSDEGNLNPKIKVLHDTLKHTKLPRDKFKTYKGAYPYLITFDVAFIPFTGCGAYDTAPEIGFLDGGSILIEIKNKHFKYIEDPYHNRFKSVYWNSWDDKFPKVTEQKKLKWDDSWDKVGLYAFDCFKGMRIFLNYFLWLQDKNGKPITDKDHKASPLIALGMQRYFSLTGNIVIGPRKTFGYFERRLYSDCMSKKMYATGELPITAKIGVDINFASAILLYNKQLTELEFDIYRDISDLPKELKDDKTNAVDSTVVRKINVYKMPKDDDLINQ